MDNPPSSTAERSLPKSSEEIIKEAKRMEESLLHSSKGHFVAATFWSRFHLWVGIPMVVCAALAGASALSKFDPSNLVSGILSLVVVCLSSVMTFLNPNEKAATHLQAGNRYDALMNNVRIFWSIECWRTSSDDILTERLKDYSEQKSKLNQSCPQIPPWAYLIAKRGIAAGEGEYLVDKRDTPA